jgi:hypothetical protein
MRIYLPRGHLAAVLAALAALALVAWGASRHDPDLVLEAPFGFLLMFVAGWIIVSALLSLLSGWPRLAVRFRAGARPAGKAIGGQVLRIGLVGERNVTTLLARPEGLYLRTAWPFALLRPALLIPWNDIGGVREHKLLFVRRFELSTSAGVTLVLGPKGYKAVAPFMAGGGT